MSDVVPTRERLLDAAGSLARLPLAAARAGILGPVRPDRLLRAPKILRHGAGLSAAVALGATVHPDGPAVTDDDGVTTFGQLLDRTARIAGGVRALAPASDQPSLAVMCRNHVGFVEALVAGSRLGWQVLFVNYELSPAQLAAVLDRERPTVLVHDADYEEKLGEVDPSLPRVIADRGETDGSRPTFAQLARDCAPVRPVAREGGMLLLTSGTTGLPKGAPRKPSALDAFVVLGVATTFLERTEIRRGEPVYVGPPAFHAFGLAALAMGLALGGGAILHRRFDAEAALAAIERHRAGTAMFVPAMLQRILELPDDVRRGYDISSARTIISGAAPLMPTLSKAWAAEYGEVLCNGYGSTEVGLGAFASPQDLRDAPGTIGRPPRGVPVRILDERGRRVPVGTTGRLYVGGMIVEEYTGGGELNDKVAGLLNTGDLAHEDAQGRLFIEGRQDDMILSGGENVFPQEVEETLLGHPAVTDAAVIGVPDEAFGQRLRAFVVLDDGATVDDDELVEHVKGRLERYKAPREVVVLDEIPRNPTGKVLRRELQQR